MFPGSPPAASDPFASSSEFLHHTLDLHQLKRSDLTGQNAGRTITFVTSFTYQHHHRLRCPTPVQLQSNRSHKVNNPWCSLAPAPLFLARCIRTPFFRINAREITFISKRLMRLFLKSEPDVRFEDYKNGKAITFHFFPLKISVVFIKKRSKFYLKQKPKTNPRRTQPTVGQAEVGP